MKKSLSNLGLSNSRLAVQTPADLARAVLSVLKKKKLAVPKLGVLQNLFDCLYFTSLKTEESRPIAVHIVYLDPNNPDPDPPRSISQDRWKIVRLSKPIRMNLANLVKIAKASDPRSSSFAVFSDRHENLFLWGLIDQGNRYHDFVNYEISAGPDRPGTFQASITGVGHLVTYAGYDKIAELKINRIVRTAIDVLRGGPVLKNLEPGIRSFIRKVNKSLPMYMRDDPPVWASEGLRDDWISSICRLLLRTQNYRHGGAFLITDDKSFSHLKIKYSLNYKRLQIALVNQAVHMLKGSLASDMIFEDYIEQDAEEIPVELYFDETINQGDYDDSRSELEGAIWFISLLSRVDGLVLMNQNLEVKGFGVEISCSNDPSNVFAARDRNGRRDQLRKINYDRFGMRHRSMMRYCAIFPNSVGFVVSQDGDVRVFTKIGKRLVMWENIRLQLHDFIRFKKVPGKIISGGSSE